MKTNLRNLFVMLTIMAVMSACSKAIPEPEKSLFDRLGGKKAIQAVVNDFIDIVRTDERIKNAKVIESMNTIDIDQLKSHLVNQVCMGAGGPCEYKGRNMKDTHSHLDISGEEFDIVIDDLIKTLNKYKVPEKEKNELLGMLGPMRPDIVATK